MLDKGISADTVEFPFKLYFRHHVHPISRPMALRSLSSVLLIMGHRLSFRATAIE